MGRQAYRLGMGENRPELVGGATDWVEGSRVDPGSDGSWGQGKGRRTRYVLRTRNSGVLSGIVYLHDI